MDQQLGGIGPYAMPAGTGPIVDQRGRLIDPRTGKPKLSSGQMLALIIVSLVAAVAIVVCACLGVLLAFAYDGCSSGSAAQNASCRDGVGWAIFLMYGGFFVLFVACVAVPFIRSLRGGVRIAVESAIIVLAPTVLVLGFVLASLAQPPHA